MTDETEQPSPEIDAVRRLLAEARHDEPMPADVAARMDRVLADLAASSPVAESAEEPSAEPPATDGGTVTRLPVQRRRRAAGLLAAAAAIVVGGVVLAQNLPGPGSGSETAGSSASEGDQYAAGGTGQSGKAPSHAPTSGRTASLAAPDAARALVRDGRVVVRGQTFSADALAGRALLTGNDPRRVVRPTASCIVPSGGEQAVAALYDRAPAALVYHRPDGSTQVVDLVLCGSSRPIRSVTLLAP